MAPVSARSDSSSSLSTLPAPTAIIVLVICVVSLQLLVIWLCACGCGGSTSKQGKGKIAAKGKKGKRGKKKGKAKKKAASGKEGEAAEAEEEWEEEEEGEEEDAEEEEGEQETGAPTKVDVKKCKKVKKKMVCKVGKKWMQASGVYIEPGCETTAAMTHDVTHVGDGPMADEKTRAPFSAISVANIAKTRTTAAPPKTQIAKAKAKGNTQVTLPEGTQTTKIQAHMMKTAISVKTQVTAPTKILRSKTYQSPAVSKVTKVGVRSVEVGKLKVAESTKDTPITKTQLNNTAVVRGEQTKVLLAGTRVSVSPKPQDNSSKSAKVSPM